MDRPDDEFETLEERLLAFQEDLAPTREFTARMRNRLLRHDVLLREGAQAGGVGVRQFWSVFTTRAYAVMTAFVFVIFTGGLSTFAYTSDGVTHGNVLYPVKRGLERIESVLVAGSTEGQAEFQVKMLGRRLAESRSLVLSGVVDPSTTQEVSLVVDSGIEAIAAIAQDEYRNQLLDQVATMLKDEEQKMYETAGVAVPVAAVAPAAVTSPVIVAPAAVVASPVGVSSSPVTTLPVIISPAAVASPALDLGKVSSEFVRSRERIRVLKEKMNEGENPSKKEETVEKKKENDDKKRGGKDNEKEQKKDEEKKIDPPPPAPVNSSFVTPIAPVLIPQVEVSPAPSVTPSVATPPATASPLIQNIDPVLPIQNTQPLVQQEVPPPQPPQENVPTSLVAPSQLLDALEKTSQHLKQMEEKVKEVKEKEKEKREQGEKKGKGGD